jgi:hypothetical protein
VRGAVFPAGRRPPAALSAEIERLYPPFVDRETERYLSAITSRITPPCSPSSDPAAPVIFLGGGCSGLLPEQLATAATKLGVEILARSGYSAQAYLDALRLLKTTPAQIEQAQAALDQIPSRPADELVTTSAFVQLQDRLRIRRAQQSRPPRRPTLYR